MSERESLTGDAARTALQQLFSTHWMRDESVVAGIDALLATGRVLVLPEPEPPCVGKAVPIAFHAASGGVLGPESRARWTDAMRALHAASLCACAADALLRRWVDEWPGSSVSLSRDTSKYLEGR